MDHILKCHDIVKTDFTHGLNCDLYDAAGRRYVDFESGLWCTALGHSHPRINRVLHEQLDKLTHLGFRYPPAVADAAASDVLEITGIDQGKCVFLSSGSEAVEFAVHVAREVSKRPRLITFSNSYLAAYGSAGRKHADAWIQLDWADGADADRMLERIPFDQVGAFVFEPGGSGSSFVHFPPRALVARIAERVRAHGGLLVAEEVTTGMGRTGQWFGFQHYGVQPDLVALGKGLGNGYPVSAVAMGHDVAQAFEALGGHYVQSHQNDPLGCCAAREVIAVLRQDGLIERARTEGEYFLEKLKQLAHKFDVVEEARGRGLLLALALHPHAQITPTRLYHALLEHGFLVGFYEAGRILRFDPALTIDRTDIDRLVDCLDVLLTRGGTMDT